MIFSKLFQLIYNKYLGNKRLQKTDFFKDFLKKELQENPYSKQDTETKNYIDTLIEEKQYDKVFDILETGTFLDSEQTLSIFNSFHHFLNYGARPLELKNEYLVTDFLSLNNRIPMVDKLISLVFHPSLNNLLVKSIENNFLNPNKDLNSIYTGSTLLFSNSFILYRYSNPSFNQDKILYFDFLGKFFSLYSKNENNKIPDEFSKYISLEDFSNFIDVFKTNKEIRELYFSSTGNDFFKDINLTSFKNNKSLFRAYLKQYQNPLPDLSFISMNGHLFRKTDDSNYPEDYTELIPIYRKQIENFFSEYNFDENSEKHSNFLKNLNNKNLEISKNNLTINNYPTIFKLWNIETENKKQITDICKTLLVLQSDDGENKNFAQKTFQELIKNIDTSFQIKDIEPSSSFFNDYLNSVSCELKTVLHKHNNKLINNLEHNNVISKRRFN